MSESPTEFEIGDVVYLTDDGADILEGEFGWDPSNCPGTGATAVVKDVIGYGKWKNYEYVIEFFGWPGKEWGTYYGEIRSIHDR